NNLAKNGFITEEVRQNATTNPIQLHYNTTNKNSGISPYARAYLRKYMEKWCSLHKKPDGSNYSIYTDGLRIYTTIDPLMQKFAVEAVDNHLSKLQKTFDKQSNIKSGRVWENHTRYLNIFVKRSRRYKQMAADGKSEEEIMNFFKTKKVKMRVFAWDHSADGIPHSVDTMMTPLDSVKHFAETLQVGFMAM